MYIYINIYISIYINIYIYIYLPIYSPIDFGYKNVYFSLFLPMNCSPGRVFEGSSNPRVEVRSHGVHFGEALAVWGHLAMALSKE